MRKTIFTITVLAALLTGCTSDPKDIVLGPEPLKQLAEQSEKIRKLPEADRVLLAQYLTKFEMGKLVAAKNTEQPVLAGRTVGEVLVLAKNWQSEEAARKAEAARLKAEAEAQAAELRARVEAERKEIAERLSNSATVIVTSKKLLPKNYQVGRYSPMLMISYAIENKSDKPIKQLKGVVTFKDAVGSKIGDLPVDFTQSIKPGETLKTDTGFGWKINEFRRGDVEKIADANDNLVSSSFDITVIAFDDGEVLQLPE